jgi:hypothetical protein
MNKNFVFSLSVFGGEYDKEEAHLVVWRILRKSFTNFIGGVGDALGRIKGGGEGQRGLLPQAPFSMRIRRKFKS